MPGGFNSSVPLDLTASFSEPLSNLQNDLLPKRKGRVGLMALFLSTLSVLAFPWHLRALLSMLNYMRYLARDSRAERLPSIRKKPPVWRCKSSSTVSTLSVVMLILKEYNLALTSSQCDASKGETD